MSTHVRSSMFIVESAVLSLYFKLRCFDWQTLVLLTVVHAIVNINLVTSPTNIIQYYRANQE